MEAYFDVRNLTPQPKSKPPGCPVSGCAAPLEKAPSQWGEMPCCPVHCIRIHPRTRTFVYYNGSDATSKRTAALRNILFERDYFAAHILGNASKAETHRICHETSEDALTWNVFSRLAKDGVLAALTSNLTHLRMKSEPELYLWGLKLCLHDSSGLSLFPPLVNARGVFEPDIARYLTEPDIMLYVPGQLLVLVEAKFTSGNTIASTGTADDVPGEKPKSRSGIVRRYTAAALPHGALLPDSIRGPFYSQLYRNLVFAIHMANQLGVEWALVSLVCERQFHQLQRKVQFQDPTRFIHTLLPKKSRARFVSYSWERLYANHVVRATGLKDLAEYMYNKSAYCAKALAV